LVTAGALNLAYRIGEQSRRPRMRRRRWFHRYTRHDAVGAICIIGWFIALYLIHAYVHL
jgi:hypothetical protein